LHAVLIPHHKQQKPKLHGCVKLPHSLKDLITTVFECLKIYLQAFAVRMIIYKFSARNNNNFLSSAVLGLLLLYSISVPLLKRLSVEFKY
jgi:hypothetical protein